MGFLISYPLQHTFIGGLFTGGFGAAMIGGLADWFAVSALFRRPLGIPFRTAIIPRNRERIFKALVEMVENEILMKENIKTQLENYNVSGILIHFMVEHRGKSYLKKILYRFLQDMLAQIKPEEIAAIIDNVVPYNNKEKVKISPYMIDILEWLIKNGYHEKIIDMMINELIIVAKNKQLKHLLSEVFIDIRENYERGMNRRKIFNRLMNLSPKQVASEAQQALEVILSEMKDTDHSIRKQINAWLNDFIIKLKTNERFQQSIEDWVQEKILRKLNLGNYVAQGMVTLYGKEAVDHKQMIRWLALITDQIDKLIADFETDTERRAELDLYIKTILSGWIDTHHGKIGMIVKDSLNEFTNDRLVNFIENKVGNDLQMIRINGSVVGGLVGMVIYLLTFWF
ncbi:DUF445 domain-containing protein [Pelosinus sp. UFO1]|uniref:DUF445 domain-containing protein n=1 Tax=Pelosinus sp. UFO1 TaxID=484770 RepID=UPI001F23F569|nr:DUF445 domain-containing protein [Pelosinus sp. UFO1]